MTVRAAWVDWLWQVQRRTPPTGFWSGKRTVVDHHDDAIYVGNKAVTV